MTAIKRTLLTAAFFMLIISRAFAEGKPPLVVEVHPVHYQQYARSIHTSGILAYKSQQTLSFKTAGPVDQLPVEAGDTVKKGELLASLVLDEINAQVDEASARVSLARHNLKRYQQLHDSNVLSLDKLQSSETDLAVAKSKLRIARFNQTYSSIKASADGLVLDRMIEKNELVTAYQPVMVLADESQGWVIRAGITDEDFVRLSLEDPASVRFDALPGETFTGQVTQMTPLARQETGTFEIEITLPATTDRLRSGFIGQIEITPSSVNRLTLVPIEALVGITSSNQTFNERQKANVLVLGATGQRAETRVVELEFIEGGLAAIRNGLQPSDLVITTGSGLLRNGEQVKVVKGAVAP